MGTDAHLGEMEGLASKLRNGGTELDDAGAPPPAPEVGVSSQAVAAAMAMLASSVAGVSEGMGIVGDAVQSGRDLYDETDRSNAHDLNNLPR